MVDLIDFSSDECDKLVINYDRDLQLTDDMSKFLAGDRINKINRCQVQLFEEAIRLSSDSDICCSLCTDLVEDIRYICITCEDMPNLCETCLKTSHSAWHITVRKPLIKRNDYDKSDSSFYCPSFLLSGNGNEDDLKGSYTTCSGPEIDYQDLVMHETGLEFEACSEASSEWDRVSILSLPDCFDLDRPLTHHSSFVKILSDHEAELTSHEEALKHEQSVSQGSNEEIQTQNSDATVWTSLNFEILDLTDKTNPSMCGSVDSGVENTSDAACDGMKDEVIHGKTSETKKNNSPPECSSAKQTSNERTRQDCTVKSFHDISGLFVSSPPEANIVDFLAQAAQHVSEVAVKTVDTLKRVLKAFHYDPTQGPVNFHSYDWIPPSSKWTQPANSCPPPSTFNANMDALIEMGFANRALNAILINRFRCNFEWIINHIITVGYKHDDYDACFMVE